MYIFNPIVEFINIPEKGRVASYLFGNPNNPPLFCVHGLTRNGRDFDYIACNLAKDYFVISIDVIGRGLSDFINEKFYTYDHYLADFYYIIKKHFNFQKINWIGTSMGGIIGMVYAAKHRDAINKLFLNDIGTIIPRKSLDRIAKYVGAQPKFTNLEDAKRHLKILLSYFGIRKEEDWNYITHNSFRYKDGFYLQNYDPMISTIFQNTGPEDREDVSLREIWAKVSATEIFVLKGEKSDILLSDDLEYMKATKPNIKTYELKNVGHAPALMSEEEIELVKSFFVKNEER